MSRAAYWYSCALTTGALSIIGLNANLFAQEASLEPEPVVFTVQQDHQNMLQQLGITRLHPGETEAQMLRDQMLPIMMNQRPILTRCCQTC